MTILTQAMRPTLAALVLLASMTVPAFAQSASRTERLQARLDERFKTADADQDGRLTRAEAEAGMPFVFRHFDEIDGAGAGSLSRDEIVAWMAAQAAARQR